MTNRLTLWEELRAVGLVHPCTRRCCWSEKATSYRWGTVLKARGDHFFDFDFVKDHAHLRVDLL